MGGWTGGRVDGDGDADRPTALALVGFVATPVISTHMALYVAVPGTPAARGLAHVCDVNVAGSMAMATGLASAPRTLADRASAIAAPTAAARAVLRALALSPSAPSLMWRWAHFGAMLTCPALLRE